MPERGPVQLLLPFLTARNAKRAVKGTAGFAALAAVMMGGAEIHRYAMEFGPGADVSRLGLSAVLRQAEARPEGGDDFAEAVTHAPDETRRAVAIGDSITVTASGGELRRFRVTGLKLLDGGCPETDPHLAGNPTSALCWAADSSGKLRFVIEVESEAEPAPTASVQQKL